MDQKTTQLPPEQALKSIQDQITGAQSVLDGLLQQVSDKSALVVTIQGQIDEIQAKLDQAGIDMEAKEKALADGFNDKVTALVANVADLQKQFDDLTAALATAKDAKTQADADLKAAQDTLMALQGNATALQATLDNLTQQVTAAQSSLDDTNAKITSGQADLESINTDIDTAKATLEATQGEIADAQKALAKAQADLAQAQAGVAVINRRAFAVAQREQDATSKYNQIKMLYDQAGVPLSEQVPPDPADTSVSAPTTPPSPQS